MLVFGHAENYIPDSNCLCPSPDISALNTHVLTVGQKIGHSVQFVDRVVPKGAYRDHELQPKLVSLRQAQCRRYGLKAYSTSFLPHLGNLSELLSEHEPSSLDNSNQPKYIPTTLYFL
jgi:hypothetical protein